ncbi:hypothetical protein C8D88_11759 [Lentzea atacamensis]|uniref:Uncharacterized protein n=2 Tax=Lentzea TaxID=165301 RepID=A0A316HJP4_9PSEU|nr:hypothetical protein [Lentzea atacamensis]PWK81437.1 hypothetical protein C8D88_11759 [Lentzea atacamensis]
MVTRIVLRVCAVVALPFGATIAAVKLGGWDVSLSLDFVVSGLIPGMVAFSIWCGGLTFTTDFVQRLRLAALGSILGMLAAKGIGYVVSLLVEESARADVQIGVYGVLEVLVAGFVLWAGAKNRWPSLDAA